MPFGWCWSGEEDSKRREDLLKTLDSLPLSESLLCILFLAASTQILGRRLQISNTLHVGLSSRHQSLNSSPIHMKKRMPSLSTTLHQISKQMKFNYQSSWRVPTICRLHALPATGVKAVICNCRWKLSNS